MSWIEHVEERVDSLIDIARVTASRLSDGAKNLLATVEGIVDADDGDESSEVPMYGHAAILMRPVPSSSAGSFEVVFVRQGDEGVPVASRETRWQIDLDEGEVVVRAFGDTAAKITLRPDGVIVLGAGGDKVALASQVNAKFDQLYAAIAGALTAPNDGGATFKAGILTAIPASSLSQVDPTWASGVEVGSGKVETE